MEKTLRSSLHSSVEDFLSAAAPLAATNPGKSAIKTLIWSITPSSDLTSSLPPALHLSISISLTSFKDSLHSSSAPPTEPPPLPKSIRRSSRHQPADDPTPDHLKNLQAYAYIIHTCISHPKKPFSPTDLLPAARLLHDSLILFEDDQILLSAVASICEDWWKDGLAGREDLIAQSLPFFLSRSIEQNKKVDVRRLYTLREAFTMFDYEDESIEDVRLLLVRCIITPVYLKVEEGRRFLAFMMGLNRRLAKEALALLKSQISMGRKSVLEGYADILFRAWKGAEGYLREEIEDDFLQGLIEGAIYAGSKPFAESVRRVLSGFIDQRSVDGVEKLLFRLAEPVLFRSLQVANSNVRQNALHLLLDLFPLEDPNVTKEVKDTFLEKQFFLLDKLLVDECPDVRAVAVEGLCRILHHFWEVIPSSTITKILSKIVDTISHDYCSEVRLSTLNGIIYLLGNPQSHEIMKVLLPRLGFMFSDPTLAVRAAVADLLLAVRDIRAFQFNKVVCVDALLFSLANDPARVSQKVTRLLIPSYFPSKVTLKEACTRCIALIKRSPNAGARFCEFALSEGSSSKSLMELLRVAVSLVLSPKNLSSDQIDGLLVASANICQSLVSEPSGKMIRTEFFSNDKLKCLLNASTSERAQISVLSIASIVSPRNLAGLHDQFMGLITNCIGVPENVNCQAIVRAVHKLMMSCGRFDEMFGTLTNTLQATASGFLMKFTLETPPEIARSLSKKNTMKSSTRLAGSTRKVPEKLGMSKTEDDLAVAAAAGWQVKDLLTTVESRNSVLKSPRLEMAFSALRVVSQVSIEQCLYLGFWDTSPLMAYTAFAVHMSARDVGLSAEQTTVDLTFDHLLNCVEKLFASASQISGNESSGSNHDEEIKCRSKSNKKDAASTSNRNEGGELRAESSRSKRTWNVMKVSSSVLMFIADLTATGFLPHKQVRCLTFASAYSRFVISEIERHQHDNLTLEEEDMKETSGYLRSSFCYAAKLLHLVLTNASESSAPPLETFDLANDLLDLVTFTESYLGSKLASKFFSVAKTWLPILILGLGSKELVKMTQEGGSSETYDSHSPGLPAWLAVLGKVELSEVWKLGQDEQDTYIEAEAPIFRKLVEMMIVLLKKGDQKILVAVSQVLLTGIEIGLKRGDYGLVLGLVHFLCVKLLTKEESAWKGLKSMLYSLRDIYLSIERDLGEPSISEDGRDKLEASKALLNSVCMETNENLS